MPSRWPDFPISRGRERRRREREREGGAEKVYMVSKQIRQKREQGDDAQQRRQKVTMHPTNFNRRRLQDRARGWRARHELAIAPSWHPHSQSAPGREV